MRLGSLFAGIGGFDLAFERAGCTPAYQVELDPNCNAVLAHHWPDVPRFPDVQEVGHGSLPEVDIIVGGFPCQDVSVAGRRAGLAGNRSGLWWQFHRVIYETAPRWVVIENVPGLLTSARGGDMGSVLWALGQLGYGFAYRVLDAQGFGVPQRRRRVFIVGCFGDDRRPVQVLLEPESDGGDLEAGSAPWQVTSALTKSGLGGGRPDDNLAQAGHLIAVSPTVASKWAKDTDGPAGDECQNLVPFRKSQRAHSADDCETWVTADRSNTLQAFDDSRPAEVAVIEEAAVRRLTPRECERLQGFPDDWTLTPNAKGKPMADSNRYRMLGNAVAVPVVEWIARRIVAADQ